MNKVNTLDIEAFAKYAQIEQLREENAYLRRKIREYEDDLR